MTEPPENLDLLIPEILDDEELLAAWVDVAIRLDPIAEARRIEIDQWVSWLRDACEPDAWKLVVEIESRVTERWESLASVLARYGFAAGRQLPRESGEVMP
jgi:hypothetical protein